MLTCRGHVGVYLYRACRCLPVEGMSVFTCTERVGVTCTERVGVYLYSACRCLLVQSVSVFTCKERVGVYP